MSDASNPGCPLWVVVLLAWPGCAVAVGLVGSAIGWPEHPWRLGAGVALGAFVLLEAASAWARAISEARRKEKR